jgi:hypothetical protein
VQILQIGGGIKTEARGQLTAVPGISREGFGRPAGAVQGDHERAGEPLPRAMLLGQPG